MSTKITNFLFAVYCLGIPVYWAYLIAYTVNGGVTEEVAASILFGWVLGMAWPMVALVQVFLWALF